MSCKCGPNRECPACIGEESKPRPIDPAKLNFKTPVTDKYADPRRAPRLIGGYRSFRAFNGRMSPEERSERGRKGGLGAAAARKAKP